MVPRQRWRRLGRTNGLAPGVDVSNKALADAMIAAIIKRFGRLDILVNNAGIGGNTPFLDIMPEEWNRTIGINLTRAFFAAQAAGR
jgi:NAD(P)-dependent dehydrogenase (short-subunit alcohol dehydrogenase family)